MLRFVSYNQNDECFVAHTVYYLFCMGACNKRLDKPYTGRWWLADTSAGRCTSGSNKWTLIIQSYDLRDISLWMTVNISSRSMKSRLRHQIIMSNTYAWKLVHKLSYKLLSYNKGRLSHRCFASTSLCNLYQQLMAQCDFILWFYIPAAINVTDFHIGHSRKSFPQPSCSPTLVVMLPGNLQNALFDRILGTRANIRCWKITLNPFPACLTVCLSACFHRTHIPPPHTHPPHTHPPHTQNRLHDSSQVNTASPGCLEIQHLTPQCTVVHFVYTKSQA